MVISMQNLIRDLKTALLEHQTIFAAPEDANYFRKKASVQPPSPLPPQEMIIPEIPKPAPKPILQPPPPPPAKPQPKPTPVFEELPPAAPPSFQDMRRLLSITAPTLSIIDAIPNDDIAQKIAQQWKTKNQTAPISILFYQEPPEQKALLEQIAKAIDTCFGPARFINAESIEKEKQWEAFLSAPDLKTVVVCDYTLWQLNSLMQFYKENPTQKNRTLGQIPLFLLPDLSLYLKDPSLKRSLWKAFTQTFPCT